MRPRRAVVFIGNSIFGDDRIGLVVGGILRSRLEEAGFDVYILERTGFALLDCLEGYTSAFVVDSICTEKNAAGEVLALSVEDFGTVKPASPHFSGVPEAVRLMRDLGLEVPRISILGISVHDPYGLSDEISADLAGMTDTIANEIYRRISSEAVGEVLA